MKVSSSTLRCAPAMAASTRGKYSSPFSSRRSWFPVVHVGPISGTKHERCLPPPVRVAACQTSLPHPKVARSLQRLPGAPTCRCNLGAAGDVTFHAAPQPVESAPAAQVLPAASDCRCPRLARVKRETGAPWSGRSARWQSLCCPRNGQQVRNRHADPRTGSHCATPPRQAREGGETGEPASRPASPDTGLWSSSSPLLHGRGRPAYR
ncbi:hypothetical protein D3C87_1434000 [compost metagenome]